MWNDLLQLLFWMFNHIHYRYVLTACAKLKLEHVEKSTYKHDDNKHKSLCYLFRAICKVHFLQRVMLSTRMNNEHIFHFVICHVNIIRDYDKQINTS